MSVLDRAPELDATHKQRVDFLSKEINGVNPTTEPEKFDVLWSIYLICLDYDERESGG